MRVIGRDERDVEVFFETEHRLGDGLVGFEAVVLNLEEEVTAAEHGLVVAGGLLGLLVVAFHQVLTDLAGEAAGEADEAFRMFGEKVFADARLLVEAMQRGFAGQADEVAVAGFVFRQDQQVVVLGVGVGELAAMVLFFADVEFTAEDRLEVLLLHRVEEVNRAIDVAVVGHGRRRLADLGEVFGQLVDVAGSVEEGVIGMKMEVRKLSGHMASLLLGNEQDG